MTLLARLLALILVAVLPSIAVLLYNGQVLRAAREQTLRQEALTYAQASADELERIVEGVRGLLLVMAQSPAIQHKDWTTCNQYMTRLADIHPGYARLAVVDASGSTKCGSGPELSGTPVAERAHFREALSGADFTVGGFLGGTGSGTGILPLAAAFRDAGGQVGGVILAGVKVDWLTRQLEQKSRPPDRMLLIADRDGTILARSPDPGPGVGQAIDVSWRQLADTAAPGTLIATGPDGERRVYGYVPPRASLARLLVIGGIGTAQGMRDIETASRRGLVLVALAGLATLIATWFVGDRLIRRPIRRLVNFTHDLGMGRYDQTVRREPGEFRALAQAFANAARRLAAREADLRASEARFHRLADLTREAIAIHDGDRIIEANSIAAVMFGFEADEVIGRPVFDFVAPEMRDEARANMSAGNESPYESTGLRKDGSRFPIEICARSIAYEGRFARVIVVRDLTARKGAEDALRRAEERYRLAARATKDLIWDWDVATGRVQLNEAAHTLFGYSAEETGITFDWWQERLHPDDRMRITDALRAAVQGTDESWNAEYRFQRADGSWADVMDRGLIVRGPDGRAVRVIGAVIDMTGRKRTESALRSAAEKNQALLREADHRIKNNLQLVSSMLGLQRASLRDSAARLAFQDARLRIQAIARVHQGFYSTGDFERADLREVLCTLRDSLLAGGGQNPAIIVDAPPGYLITAAKATPLALIANELITNALKHGFPPGRRGTVTVRCTRAPDGGIVLTVADDGIGLPPDIDIAASAGFGLRLVRTLASQIGARIEVRRQDTGTAIEVRVPPAA